jgi:hypothetical protein
VARGEDILRSWAEIKGRASKRLTLSAPWSNVSLHTIC